MAEALVVPEASILDEDVGSGVPVLEAAVGVACKVSPAESPYGTHVVDNSSR